MIFGLGSWRFLLAFFVAISHLWASMFGGPAAYAVWGFFVLSGFLMTEILRNKYGFTMDGIQKYAFNRFIRIFPLYYLSLLFGLIIIYILKKNGIAPTVLNPQFYLPESTISWFANITLLPLSDIGGRPVPVSGALAVEIEAYILIPFMAYSRNAAWLGAIMSLLVSLKLGINLESFPARYSDLLTGYFSFAVGTLINHYKDELQNIAMPKVSVFLWLLHCLMIGVINTWPWTYGLYVSVILSAWVVISLHKLDKSKIDILLGDLSYPVYLLHTTVAAGFLLYFDASRSLIFFLITFLITIFVSYVLLIVFDHPIQKFKKKANTNRNLEITADMYLSKMFYKVQAILVHSNTVRIAVALGVVIAICCSIFMYKVVNNKTLEVYNWGPQETIVGTIPNLQPNGNAGIWIETSLTLGLGKLEVIVNGTSVYTEISSNLITASIPKELFKMETKLNILVLDTTTKKTFNVGNLIINQDKTYE